MSNQMTLEKFNEIYSQTYQNTLKYIVLHCDNLEDVNDLLQETYLNFYKYEQRKSLDEIKDIKGYIIGISKNILKKHYRFKYKNKVVSINKNEEIPLEADIDLELQFITKENVEYIWKYIKDKDIKIAKIFYLHYCLDMKISDIAEEMQLNESTVKNYIYRTIKELQKNLKKESDDDEQK